MFLCSATYVVLSRRDFIPGVPREYSGDRLARAGPTDDEVSFGTFLYYDVFLSLSSFGIDKDARRLLYALYVFVLGIECSRDEYGGQRTGEEGGE